MKSQIKLVGHSHIDAVWLWDRQETKEVLTQTLGRMLDLMDDNPELTFVQTSAHFYKWLEEDHPGLFERIREKVAEGSWEIVGGMWIEPDCNIPSGESLIRQLLYGKRYFQEKFGIDVRVAWLPDVFGFGGSLPQIFSKSGIDYFFTSKLNWQTALPFPHFAFWWEAADGSRVLGYQTPGMYNNTSIYNVYKQNKRFQFKTGIDKFLAPYGEGDHGGGLNQQLIDNALTADYEDVEIDFGRAGEYFEELADEHGEELPVVRDELYLKTHRGTLSTQAWIKRENRRGEISLDITERLAVLEHRLLAGDYPARELTDCWRKLLFNQFHDALPGTSIKKVYQDAARDYKEIYSKLDSLTDDRLQLLAGEVDTTGPGQALLVFNPLAHRRSEIVELTLPLTEEKQMVIKTDNGRPLTHQRQGEKLLIEVPDLPALGYKQLRLGDQLITDSPGPGEESEILLKPGVLENKYYRLEVSRETGVIESIFDKQNLREVLGEKGGNFLQVFQDETTKESAWNICPGRLENLSNLESITEKTEGPLTVALELVYRYQQPEREDSLFRLAIALKKKDPVIYFDLEVDWYARFRTVKTAFQFKEGAEFVTYEVPDGSIKRRDPLSDQADPVEREKWEVAGQKWVDYTYNNGEYGISLLNDCKYAFDQQGRVLRMTLLRSPVYPNPARMGLEPREDGVTDQGWHKLRYGLYPHQGDWRQAQTPARAYDFNYPILVRREASHAGSLPRELTYLKTASSNIIISSLKKAEDNGALIVRLYETDGCAGVHLLEFYERPAAVFEGDLMENKTRKLNKITGNSLEIELGEYEIKTLIVDF
ncbi:MAG: alpha-mannosidase [Bacillota bacterium]